MHRDNVRYVKMVINAREEVQELLIAELSDLGFDAFEQEEGRLVTYCPEDDYAEREPGVRRLLKQQPDDIDVEEQEVIEEQNWNREWEKTISARRIGQFWVRPTWDEQDPDTDLYELVIDPKMSFGTGYHETTQLMLEFLPGIVNPGDTVLDVGTGTGILAIAAARIGASKVTAVDIDSRSVENAEENISINEVETAVTVLEGSIGDLPGKEAYDVILANINRNTILELSQSFRERLADSGRLLLSGLYRSDRQQIIEDKQMRPFQPAGEKQKGKWIALLFTSENG